MCVCNEVKNKREKLRCLLLHRIFLKKMFCYEVIVKQKNYKRSSNYYLRCLLLRRKKKFFFYLWCDCEAKKNAPPITTTGRRRERAEAVNYFSTFHWGRFIKILAELVSQRGGQVLPHARPGWVWMHNDVVAQRRLFKQYIFSLALNKNLPGLGAWCVCVWERERDLPGLCAWCVCVRERESERELY